MQLTNDEKRQLNIYEHGICFDEDEDDSCGGCGSAAFFALAIGALCWVVIYVLSAAGWHNIVTANPAWWIKGAGNG